MAERLDADLRGRHPRPHPIEGTLERAAGVPERSYRDDAMMGDEKIGDAEVVAPRPAKPERPPIVEVLGILRREEGRHHHRIPSRMEGRGVAVHGESHPSHVRRGVRAACEGELACDLIASLDWDGLAGPRPAAGDNRIGCRENLVRALIRHELAERVNGCGVPDDPASGALHVREPLKDPKSGDEVHLHPPVLAGHPDAEEPGLAEGRNRAICQVALDLGLWALLTKETRQLVHGNKKVVRRRDGWCGHGFTSVI